MDDQTGSPSSHDPINVIFFVLNEAYRNDPDEYRKYDAEIEVIEKLERQFR